jgi:hypothetical protein
LPPSQRTSVSWIVTEPLIGGQLDDPLSDDEDSLEDELLSLDEDSLELLDDDSLELLLLEELLSLDELLLLLLLDDEELLDELDDDEEELDDDELEELELDEDDELELGSSQQPSPSCTTSHFSLSAIHLAQPNVPAGTLLALPQPHSPPEEASALQRSGQTTPSES